MEDLEPEPARESFIRKIYSSKRSTYVYGLIDPRDRSLFWVGMTNSPKLRYDQHTFEIVTNNPEKQKRIDDIKASGNQPGMVLIEEFSTREEAAVLEKNLIVFLSGVSGINLKNIEHRPNEGWFFIAKSKAQMRNEPWDAEQRVVLIHYYNQGIVCELIAFEMQRTKPSIHLELCKLEKAELLKIRRPDRVTIDETKRKCKFPLRDLSPADIKEVSDLIPRVSSRYGHLNAAHIRQHFVKKPDDEKK